MHSQVLKEEGDNIVKSFVCRLMWAIRENVTKWKRAIGELPRHTPAFFHNLTGYDTHLFVIELAAYGFGKMEGFPSNEKNYILFSKYVTIDGKIHEVLFLDSHRFLDGSIEKLVEELHLRDMVETSKYFPNVPTDILEGKGF